MRTRPLTASWALRPEGWWARPFSPGSPPPFLERTIQRTTQGMEGVWEVELQDAQGQAIPCECSVRRRQLDNRQVRVVAVRDIRTRLAAEAEIRQLAHFDALTGLSNRRSLLEQVVQELAAADLQPRRAALATININAFQSVNDSLGMAAGDIAHHGTAAERAAEPGPKAGPGGW